MKKMLWIVPVLLFVMAGAVFAGQVSLQWDSSQAVIDGYRVYSRLDGSTYGQTPAWQGQDTACTIDGLVDGSTYYFVVRAYRNDTESPSSNEVSKTIGAIDPPTGLTDQKQDQLDVMDAKLDDILRILKPAELTGFCGNPESMIFHKASHWCGAAAVKFSTSQDAIAAGYSVCRICKP